jgi:hypothetical protein
MVVRAEDRAAARGLVAPHSLEDARSIMDDVADDVNVRVIPVHELPVAPDLRGPPGAALRHEVPSR